MNRHKTFKLFLAVNIFVLGFSSVAFAKSDEQKSMSTAVSALYEKLQKDMTVDKVDLRLGEIVTHNLSADEFEISGTATANQLPLSFDVKVNSKKNQPVTVSYNFTKEANLGSEVAEADMEVVLNNLLMAKISADHKTPNIVIAPDGFKAVQIAGKKVFKGTGEVRIGDVDWNRMTFEITLDSKDAKKSTVVYKVQ